MSSSAHTMLDLTNDFVNTISWFLSSPEACFLLRFIEFHLRNYVMNQQGLFYTYNWNK